MPIHVFLDVGTKLGVTTANYTIVVYSVNSTSLEINGSQINISGVDPYKDVFFLTSGFLVYTDVSDVILNDTLTEEDIVIVDFFNSTGTVSIVNMSGNFTNMTVCYNTTAQGNFSLFMDDLNGDCNYGWFNSTLKVNSITDIKFPRGVASFTSCGIMLYANSTAGAYCVEVREDEGVSEAKLATLVALTAVSIGSVLYSKFTRRRK